MVVLVGVIVGATQAGILGAFLAAPVLTTPARGGRLHVRQAARSAALPAPDAPGAGRRLAGGSG
ncbi:hypothetical protein [Candidatus Amarolinea dominans]|uniref:hypothetical protein n=1 Tax=Candidatus Amarolinea dominans TaxID=3140696 RepID=UPI001D2F7275|nr:hypothetical protein [Anaerolineae bacterium]